MIPLFSKLSENLENLHFSTTTGFLLTSDSIKVNVKKFDFLKLLGGWMTNFPRISRLFFVTRTGHVNGASRAPLVTITLWLKSGLVEESCRSKFTVNLFVGVRGSTLAITFSCCPWNTSSKSGGLSFCLCSTYSCFIHILINLKIYFREINLIPKYGFLCILNKQDNLFIESILLCVRESRTSAKLMS